MWSIRSVLLVVLAFIASTQALLLQTAGHLGLHSAASCAASRVEACPCMRCRTNLKKEKRLRNRINAFRFKKGGFGPRRRFSPIDHAAIQKKADEDNQFYAMVFTYTAEAEAAALEEAKKNPPKKEEAAAPASS